MERAGRRGFSAIEMLIVVVMIGALVGIAYPYLRSFTERERARRSIEAASREVSIARSLAIRSGRSMAIVANETSRTLVTRDTTGTEYRRLDLGDESDLRVLTLDVDVAGDSIVFGPRGVCLNCDPVQPSEILITTHDRDRIIRVNLLGRTEVVETGS